MTDIDRLKIEHAELCAKERERCAQLVDVMLDQTPWKDHMMARGALALAARVIRRGRHLTADEKMENLRQAIYHGDCDGDAEL